MRRGAVIITLVLVMMLAGLIAQAFSPAIVVPGLEKLNVNQVCGTGLLLGALAAALLGILSLRRGARELARQIAANQSGADPTHPDLSAVADAVAAAREQAAQAVARAELRAKELEIQLKVVTAERQHLEAIIYSISDAVLVTDPFDELVLANDSAARMFNFELGGADRAPIHRLLNDPQVIALIRDMRQSNSRGGRRIVEHKTDSPSGERVYKVTLSCINSAGEDPAGVVAVLHDMTREREVGKMKSDFVSNVSHELRTPLASIKAYAEMLIDGEAADARTAQEFYEVIHNEANRLGRLIDNILNISRIESGVMKINKLPLCPMVLLKEGVEVIAPQARQKRIAIEEQISPAIYQTLADRDMLYEAILNLLSNAVKYTPEGGVVRVQTAVDEARKVVICRISDTGVGIPPKDLPFIFDKFYRSEANNRMAKGTGLGLSLVKHIVETVHHGRLFVESDVGKGSSFGFELALIE